ncbi:MAG: hypothetical protein U9O49_02265 [Candidatus Thermoplasmatota archaeon]|nr:hypothetical protein [Candidatus Thermoplasmatota archaeon]
MGDGVLTGYVNRDVCKDCGYQGMPIIFDSEDEYKKFLASLSKDKEARVEKPGQVVEDKIENEHVKLTKNEKQLLEFLNEPTKEKPTETHRPSRPLGVTILSFIMIVNAIFIVCLYYSLMSVNIVLWLWAYYIIVFIISAIILPYGLLKGKEWAWTIGAILYALSIPIGLFFLYYLTRPHVKAYFGKT